MLRKVLNASECKSVYTLNTWTDEKKQEVNNYLQEGYYVHLGSTALGHTMAEIVEYGGIKWAMEEYGEKIEIIRREGWGEIYIHKI